MSQKQEMTVFEISKKIEKTGKTTTSSLLLSSFPLPTYSDLKIFRYLQSNDPSMCGYCES